MVSKTDNAVTTNYTYDYANRLTSIRNSQSEIRNSYDGYGRRVSRLVKGSGLGIPEAEKTEYLWEGTNVLLEFYQNQNNPLEYIYGNGQLLARDDLLVLPVSKRLVYQNTHWFHQDGLGSVVNLTDGTGKVKLSYDYDAFGEITKEEGQVGWKKNRYTFTGKPYDPSAGMYYFGARYYEPQVGRFVTKDPLICTPEDERIVSGSLHPIIAQLIITQGLTNPQNTHPYMYCYNNPIVYIDPWGYCGEKIVIGGLLIPELELLNINKMVSVHTTRYGKVLYWVCTQVERKIVLIPFGIVGIPVGIVGGIGIFSPQPLNENEKELLKEWMAKYGSGIQKVEDENQ